MQRVPRLGRRPAAEIGVLVGSRRVVWQPCIFLCFKAYLELALFLQGKDTVKRKEELWQLRHKVSRSGHCKDPWRRLVGTSAFDDSRSDWTTAFRPLF
jgi:hypothetical protein